MSIFTAKILLLVGLFLPLSAAANSNPPILWGSSVVNTATGGISAVAFLTVPLQSPTFGGTITHGNGGNEITPAHVQTPTLGTNTPTTLGTTTPTKWIKLYLSDGNLYWIPLWR